MALIPVFKKCSRDYLMNEWELDFPVSEWVEAVIDGQHYESNRYDVVMRDHVMGKTISVYLYMDEDSEEVLAIDEVVKDVDEDDDIRYPLDETPFADVLEDILSL